MSDSRFTPRASDPSDPSALSIAELEATIRHHNQLYWEKAAPEIPDQVYDRLVLALRHRAPDSPVLDEIDAPSAEAAPADANSDADLRALTTGTKLAHEHPMLSLDKCYTEAELTTWFGRFEGDAVASHKIDGVAISIRYDASGQLLVASTRGNGRVGDVITENVRRVAHVPATLPAGLVNDPIEVRGEAYMPLSVFEDRYAQDFANPRNLTAGALKQKNPDKTGAYGIAFFAYDILGSTAPSELAKRELLISLGFEPAPTIPVPRDSGQTAFDTLAADRATLDYETDGIVFKVDDVAQHDTLGLTAHHPRYAIAYKYQGESGESTLDEVLWSVSRTGAINPVASIQPVSLSGVTVTRVSLHNLGIIERLAGAPMGEESAQSYALSKGARVYVTRRGGVIPHIENIITPGDAGLELPAACPSCGGPTERRDDFLFAEHSQACGVQATRRLLHFVSVTDIQGIGPKLMEQLFDAEVVREPADLYELTVAELQKLERMGLKSAQNIVDAIAGRKSVPWTTLLASLGISDVGPQVAIALSRTFDSLQALRDASADALINVDGVGEIVAGKLIAGLEANATILDNLLQHVDPIAVEHVEATGPLAGRAFVFTGTLVTMGRKEAQALVKAAGGNTPSSVTAATDFLVLPDDDFAKFESGKHSAKMKAAQKLIEKGSALRVISETEFVGMVGSNQ